LFLDPLGISITASIIALLNRLVSPTRLPNLKET